MNHNGIVSFLWGVADGRRRRGVCTTMPRAMMAKRKRRRDIFDHVVTDRLQDMVDTNFKFYKRITDDREFSKFFRAGIQPPSA